MKPSIVNRIKSNWTLKRLGKVAMTVAFTLVIAIFLLAMLGTVVQAAGLVDDTVNVANEYSRYPLENYQLDFYVDNSWGWLPWNWSDGIGKQVMYGLYAITNFIWTISLYVSNATGYLVQEAYSLDFISATADSIGKNMQTLAGVSANGFSTEGFYVGFLLLLILVLGVYVAYTGLIKRETTKAIHAIMNFVLVFILSAGYPFFLIAFLQIVTFAGIYFKLGDLMSMFSLQSNDSQSVGSRVMRKPRMLMHAHMHRLQRKLGRSMTTLGAGSAIVTGKKGQSGSGSSARTQADHSRPDGKEKSTLGKRIGQTIGTVADTKDRMVDTASGLKEQVKDLPTNARYAVYQGKSKVKENVRDLTSSISQTKADRASGRKEQQEQRRKTIAKRRSEMEQVKQKKQPASSVHERPTTRQEQYHDEQTSKQSNIQTSYKESQQAKQERPAVKSDFSSPKVERQGNTVQEKTVQKPATSTTTADRTSQRPITKERPSTVQRVPLQNTRSRPPIKTATIKKVGKKP